MSKHPVIHTDDVWTVYLEIGAEDAAFLHIALHKPWSKSVFKHIKELSEIIKEAFRVKGFSRIFCATEEPRVKKLAQKLNFIDTDLEVVGEDNIKRGVQVCHLH